MTRSCPLRSAQGDSATIRLHHRTPCSSTPTATSPTPTTTPTAPRSWRAPGPPGVARIVVIGESRESAERALALRGGRAAAVGDRRRPPPRRERLDRRGRRTGCARRLRRPARWWRPARWVSTITTTIRPATSSDAAFEAQLGLARGGWQAGGDPRPRGGRRRGRRAAGQPGTSPPSCTRSAAGPGSCGRGWTSATMCRSAGW